MFALELLDVAGVVDVFVSAQIVFVGESSSARWAWIGTLFGWEMYGEVDVEEGLADGDVGALVTLVGSGTRGHILGAKAACGSVAKSVELVEMASEGGAAGESFDAQGTLVDVGEMCLRMEDSLERVVGPVGAVCARVTAAGS